MSQMRDLPPIAGAIIWARQIERQLLTYMKRVEDVEMARRSVRFEFQSEDTDVDSGDSDVEDVEY